MANAAFDTLTVSKELQDAGLEARQADAIALAVKQGQGDLATKQDIALLKTELKSDIDHLKSDIDHLKSDIDHLESDMKSGFNWIKWALAIMMAMMLGGFTLIASS